MSIRVGYKMYEAVYTSGDVHLIALFIVTSLYIIDNSGKNYLCAWVGYKSHGAVQLFITPGDGDLYLSVQ